MDHLLNSNLQFGVRVGCDAIQLTFAECSISVDTADSAGAKATEYRSGNVVRGFFLMTLLCTVLSKYIYINI